MILWISKTGAIQEKVRELELFLHYFCFESYFPLLLPIEKEEIKSFEDWRCWEDTLVEGLSNRPWGLGSKIEPTINSLSRRDVKLANLPFNL